MSLTEQLYASLIKYLDRKFDRHYKMQNELIAKQNEILDKMLAFWMHGSSFKEEEFQSAEEDKIDDDYGEYNVREQAEKQVKKDWVDSGYLNDPLFPKRD